MKIVNPTPSHAMIIASESENVKLFVSKKLTEDTLESFETIISMEVAKRASGLAPGLVAEIKQNVRIKLWRAIEARLIHYPPAYIKAIVTSVFNDLGRGRKLPESLSLDDYGEVKQGRVLINQSEGWGNPEQIAEQREKVADYLASTVEAILKLPPRQKQAMLCLIIDRFDDIEQLQETFERFHIPFDMYSWPEDKAEAQRLRASIYAARPKMADCMNATMP